MKKIIITIDGHSACGKSTLAKALATELNYGYIDTGAMYRAVTFFFLENRVNIQKTTELQRALTKINITFKSTVSGNRTFLNGKDVEDVIRKMFVSKNVSHVAAISDVRKIVVKQQKEMGKEKGIVMEGRDIGTVVFPDAELKIFLTADQAVRTKRRYNELLQKGQRVSMKSVQDNLVERDRIDSTRKDSPLKKAEDAIIIDNSKISQREQLAMTLALAKERIRMLSMPKKVARPVAVNTTKDNISQNKKQENRNPKTPTRRNQNTSKPTAANTAKDNISQNKKLENRNTKTPARRNQNTPKPSVAKNSKDNISQNKNQENRNQKNPARRNQNSQKPPAAKTKDNISQNKNQENRNPKTPTRRNQNTSKPTAAKDTKDNISQNKKQPKKPSSKTTPPKATAKKTVQKKTTSKATPRKKPAKKKLDKDD